MSKNLGIAGVVIALIMSFSALIFGGTDTVNTVREIAVGASPGPDHYNQENFKGGLTTGHLQATSTTATTYTLLQADIGNYDKIFMTPNVGALTLTFPASSTIPSFLPKAGDSMKQCWHNATTTASQTITFAAGTGIDIEVSTSSTNALTINPDGFSCLEYVRKPSTASAFDIAVLMTHFDDGD